MSDLVNRILDCVPAGTYALRALFQLVDIVESDEVATAAVEGGYAPRMLVNPEFVERYAATPERLVMLVMHELHHIILGHTRLLPTSTKLDNIVFDAVINAMLCRAFPDPAGIAFLTDFYAADRVPEAILRPPSRWQPEDERNPISKQLVDAGYQDLALAHRGLYSPAGATYEEVREALEKSCTEAEAAGVKLIGGHDEGGLQEGNLEDRAPVLLDVIRQIVEQWPQPPEPIRGRSLADALQSTSSDRTEWWATGLGCASCCAGPAASPTVARSVRWAPWSRPQPRPWQAASAVMSWPRCSGAPFSCTKAASLAAVESGRETVSTSTSMCPAP